MRSIKLIIFIIFLTFKFIINSSTDDLINKSKLNSDSNNLKLSNKINSLNKLSTKLTNKQETINDKIKHSLDCERFDNEFFHYLLKRYNKDNQHNGRMKRLCENLHHTATSCDKSNENLFKLINQSNRHQYDEDDFNFSKSIIKICPLILFRFGKQQCLPKQIDYKSNRPTAKQVWTFAFIFVTIISCCSLVGVIVMPFTNNNIDSYRDAFNLFEGLAVGSLLASSLFHVLPQAFNLTNNKNDDYLGKAMLIFGGIYLFFWSEILMKLMAELRNELRNHSKKKSITKTNLELIEDEKRVNYLMSNSEMENKKEDKLNDKNKPQQISNVAWMIIFGDGLHNFIDGLSIGAAFTESILSGISVSIAVICEEFPHELGDFAVLIASGMTIKQAVVFNFASACTCYLGAIVGILIGDISKTSSYILALAGGMFLYISLNNIMSELTNAIDEAFQKSKSKMFKILLYQNIGILTGIYVLYLLAKYSENLRIDSLTNHLIN